MSMRKQLEVQLRQVLPDERFDVVGSRREVTPGDHRAVVQLERTSLKPLPEAPIGQWLASFDIVIVIGGRELSESNEDKLEDRLGELLDLLDAHPFIVWESADRASYNDDFPNAYKITATLSTERSA